MIKKRANRKNLDSVLYKTWQVDKMFFISNPEVIAAIIGDIVVFNNRKKLNCIGALSFYLGSVHAFS